MIGIIFYLVNAFYAFNSHGFFYGLVNMVFPFAIIVDFAKALMGR